jgi:hypothetical protein
VDAVQVRPSMVRRFTRLPLAGRLHAADTADRIVNRLWDYPRGHPTGRRFDLFTSSTTATRIW